MQRSRTHQCGGDGRAVPIRLRRRHKATAAYAERETGRPHRGRGRLQLRERRRRIDYADRDGRRWVAQEVGAAAVGGGDRVGICCQGIRHVSRHAICIQRAHDVRRVNGQGDAARRRDARGRRHAGAERHRIAVDGWGCGGGGQRCLRGRFQHHQVCDGGSAGDVVPVTVVVGVDGMRAGCQRRRRARHCPAPVQVHLVAARDGCAVSKEGDHSDWRTGLRRHSRGDRDRLPEHRRIGRQLDGCGRYLRRRAAEGQAGGAVEITSGSKYRLDAAGIDFDNRLAGIVSGVQVAVFVDRQAARVVKRPARGVYALHPGRRHLDDTADVGCADVSDVEIVVGVEGQPPRIGNLATLGEHALYPGGSYLDDAVR